MATLLDENLVPLIEASRHVPRRPHPSTLRRWAYEGIDGVRLESCKIGGRRFTTVEALRRFMERLTGGSECP
jgi:hypothetical protein